MSSRTRATTILLLCFSSLLFPQEGSQRLEFHYSFLYKSGANEIKAIPSSQSEIELSSHDELKIYLQPVKNVYLYLFHQDLEGTLSLIYPRTFDEFNSGYTPGKSTYFPRGLEWIKLDGSGEERFYLLASVDRLQPLESEADAYLKAYYSKTAGHDKVEELKQTVLDEIRRLQMEHLKIVRQSKEDIVLIAGEFRGSDKDLRFPAQNITGDGFYAKVIRIIH